jgi:LPXTG-motif cell wall-anchored protein
MDSTSIAVGVAFLVALGLYLLKRRARVNKD